MQQLFSPQTLATHLGLAQQTIYNRHSRGGDLPKAIKLGHLLPFSPNDVDLAECKASDYRDCAVFGV